MLRDGSEKDASSVVISGVFGGEQGRITEISREVDEQDEE